MTWFLMLCNGQWRKHTKLCGVPSLNMVDLSGNGPFMTWIKLQMLSIKMFLRKLIKLVVSEVLLILVAILWLLEGHALSWHCFLSLLCFVLALPGWLYTLTLIMSHHPFHQKV